MKYLLKLIDAKNDNEILDIILNNEEKFEEESLMDGEIYIGKDESCRLDFRNYILEAIKLYEKEYN